MRQMAPATKVQLFFQACEAGGAEDVLRLLREGADANSFDLSGNTPLMNAGAFGHAAIVQLLIDQGGAKLDTVDKDGGRSALIWAILMSRVEIALLLAARMDAAALNRADNSGKTALDWADIGGDFSEKVEEFKPVAAAIRARGGLAGAELAARS